VYCRVFIAVTDVTGMYELGDPVEAIVTNAMHPISDLCGVGRHT
jgi:hypothetical protein